MTNKKVTEGQHYKEKVFSIGVKGDPMIKVNGLCVFFKSDIVQVDDMVIVKVTKKLDKVGFGELVEVC